MIKKNSVRVLQMVLETESRVAPQRMQRFFVHLGCCLRRCSHRRHRRCGGLERLVVILRIYKTNKKLHQGRGKIKREREPRKKRRKEKWLPYLCFDSSVSFIYFSPYL